MGNINGQLIKQKRQELNLSQDSLAKKIGVSKVTICWYENGERTPSLENFLKLADILNVSLDQLVGREVSVVGEKDEYKVYLPKKDLEIISSIKEYPKLYNTLYNDPVRTVKLLDKKLK